MAQSVKVLENLNCYLFICLDLPVLFGKHGAQYCHDKHSCQL
jgi:hypothetical protein